MPYNQIGLNNHMRVRGDYNDVAGNQTTNVYVGETDIVLPSRSHINGCIIMMMFNKLFQD